MESLWRKETKQLKSGNNGQRFIIEDDYREIIVIGAGMAGILIAYYLQKAGKKVLVLEADQIASGQTERTTAKITSQHGLKYSNLIKTVGYKKASLYAGANEGAIREYERLIREEKIGCQFERVPAYLYSRYDKDVLKEEADAASNLGIDAHFTMKTELPFPVIGAVCFDKQAQFSPLAFLKAIVAELEVWENTRVISIKGNRVMTKDRVLRADKIVMASHYPFLNLPGCYFLRQHQERSYVLALSDCERIEGMYYGIDPDGLSVRQAGEYLLLGGGSHRTGSNKQGESYDFLMAAAKQFFPRGKIAAKWSAQDCMPHDGIPFIGKYSLFTPHLYVATGFQKWGMTSSMVAAMILRDELLGIDNPYQRLFSPQRIHFRAGAENLLADTGISVKGLVKGMFHKPEKEADTLAPGHGGIVTIEGKRYACYREENGDLHSISAKCPHMGCELVWNPDEKSWDCPCHGSRFTVDGKLLDNPANTDVKVPQH